jgi:hypothetical protein
MKGYFSLLAILICFILSCNSTDHQNLSSNSVLVLDLANQKETIDTLFAHSTNKLLVFAKQIDKKDLIQIKDTVFPENIETTYNILKDGLGQITISEYPYSESGDWYLVLSHYFDKNGKTFAFERQTNFFNSFCVEGVAYETKTEFYNDEFKLIANKYKLADEKGRMLHKDSCQFPYDYPYKVFPNFEKYLAANKIKIPVKE